jgi:hypothetical protein
LNAHKENDKWENKKKNEKLGIGREDEKTKEAWREREK